MAVNERDVVDKPLSDIPVLLSVFWLDTQNKEYFKFKDAYSEKLGINDRSWSFYDDKVYFLKTLKSITPLERIILITSGSLATQIIQDIHDLEQLHSVYIFCQSIPKYLPLAETYKKIKGIQSDSNRMYQVVRANIEILQAEEAARNAAIPPKHSRPQPKADEKDVDFFAQPGTHWCPWTSNSCSQRFAVSGQGTVEIMLRKPISFELYLSNKEDPNDSTAYNIVLSIDETEAKIGSNNHVLDSSKQIQHILQPDNDKWHTYWISLFKDTRNVKYGIGEVRAGFTIFNVFLKEEDINAIKQVAYLHVKMNRNDRMLTDLSKIRDDVRFFIGKEPVVYDPAIFVIPQEKYSIEIQSAIPPSKLERPCRDLYDSIINFRLNTEDFPDFVQAIEYSVKNPAGWCHKKLQEKANRFGRPNPLATYLRITYGERLGNSPGHAYVIEIWPAGHYSPIHNHSNAYGIIRVLSGRLLAKMYPELNLKAAQYPAIEQILDEGQVIWMLPNLNQTHQVRNPDLYGSSAISIQCYQYGQDDNMHYEYFDYISNDGLSIDHFDPKSDMDYVEFKELIKREWLAKKIFQ